MNSSYNSKVDTTTRKDADVSIESLPSSLPDFLGGIACCIIAFEKINKYIFQNDAFVRNSELSEKVSKILKEKKVITSETCLINHNQFAEKITKDISSQIAMIYKSNKAILKFLAHKAKDGAELQEIIDAMGD